MNLDELIELVVKNPTNENKELYNDFVSSLEFDLIKEDKRKESFLIRGKCATKILCEWFKVYGSTEGCPASYQDTLNIPFKLEKNNYLKESKK